VRGREAVVVRATRGGRSLEMQTSRWVLGAIVAVAGSGLAVGVAAAETGTKTFACVIPWKGEVTCSNKFSIPKGGTLTIAVTKILDSDGDPDKEKCPYFHVTDQNTSAKSAPIYVCKDESKDYKNPSSTNEMVVEVSVNIDRTFERIITGSYTVK
jgi:hypothetical protein